MATLFVDGKPYAVDGERNVLDVCLSLGFDLPYFCWHPELGSVGSCRQCAVKQFKDADDDKGHITMACMTPAKDGTRISIDDPDAAGFRRSVIEWLMTNHPHDCPVCEEGGECHLQDVTVMTGHAYRRYDGAKRTFRNQDLGPFLTHEMNRCITCYRCVRFYRHYAGGTDLNDFGIHNHVYFGRHADGPLDNEFSGNLAEVCPTGVFTDKTLSRRYARKWDMTATPSVCMHCGLGCNTTANTRYGEMRRVLNRYNDDVNRYFLCDRGRYGYDVVNRPDRLTEPLIHDQPQPSTSDALAAAEQVMSEGRVLGIGSPRASVESNFALRTLVGADNFYLGVSDVEARIFSRIVEILATGSVPTPSLHEIERADAVLVLGEDLTNTAPRLALAVRQSLRQAGFQEAAKADIPAWLDDAVRQAAGETRSPLFLATPDATKLDEVASLCLKLAPADIARLGFAVAHAIDPDAPAPDEPESDLGEWSRTIANSLAAAERPVVIAGTTMRDESIVAAAANVAFALHRKSVAAKLAYTVPEADSLGLALIGGRPLGEALNALQQGHARSVLVLENDLYRRASSPLVDAALSTARHVVALDWLPTATTRHADIVLPVGSFADSDGTLVSSEGRAQRFYRALAPDADAPWESWRWLAMLGQAAGKQDAMAWQTLGDVTGSCAERIPAISEISAAAPDAAFRVSGMRVARAPHRYSGRTAMVADRTVHEPKPPEDPNSPFSFSMEGYHGEDLPADLLSYTWAPHWNSVQALNKFQEEIGGPLRGGESGRRLVAPRPNAQTDFVGEPPPAFERRPGRVLLLPHHHIFTSEELSSLSPPVAERGLAPFVAMNPADAAEAGLEEGSSVIIAIEGDSPQLRRPLVLHRSLARGCAALLVGWPGDRWIALPSYAALRRCEAA